MLLSVMLSTVFCCCLTLQAFPPGSRAGADSQFCQNPTLVGMQREAELEATRQAAEKAHNRRGGSAGGEGADAAEDEEEDGGERSLNKVQ